MPDYLKIHSLPVLPVKLLNNGLLTFTHSNISTEGEVLNRWQIAHFQTLTFKVKGKNSKLSGSLHKYKQDGKNWQDFNLFDIQEVIHELSETFEFDPEKAVLNFIEIGINFPLDYDPNQLINCFVLYRNIPFEKMKVTGKGFGKIADANDFTIKVYSKSLQYGLPFHLLRFEIKVKRIGFLKRYGINGLTLSDLTRPEIYPKFKKMLLDILSGILIYNPDTDPDKLTNLNDRELLKLGRYPEYWQQYERRRKNEKSKDLIKFKELTGTNEVLKILNNKISDKWEMLFNPDKIHTFQDRNKKDKIHTFSKEQNNPINDQTGQNTPTINGDIVRTCLITKIDISMQRKDSSLLSNTGLKWLRKNKPSKYEEVKKKYLPRRGVSGQHTKYEGNEIPHLSKQIRNVFYNNQRGTIDLKNQLRIEI